MNYIRRQINSVCNYPLIHRYKEEKNNTTYCIQSLHCYQTRQFTQIFFFYSQPSISPIRTLSLPCRPTPYNGFELSRTHAQFFRAMLSLLPRQLFLSFQSKSLLHVPPGRALQRVSSLSLPPHVFISSAITVETAIRNTLETLWEGARTSIDHITGHAPALVIAAFQIVDSIMNLYSSSPKQRYLWRSISTLPYYTLTWPLFSDNTKTRQSKKSTASCF